MYILGLRKGENNHEEIWLLQNEYKRTTTDNNQIVSIGLFRN